MYTSPLSYIVTPPHIGLELVWSTLYVDEVRSLAAVCMQCWTLIRSAYSYKIEYIPSSANACADCLSHLLVSDTKIHPAEKGNEVHATNCVTSAQDIANLTARDKLLSDFYVYSTWHLAILNARWAHPLPLKGRWSNITRWLCALGENVLSYYRATV